MTKVSAILLAAGLSERMGGPNKMLIEVDDQRIIERTYQNLSRSRIDELVLVTGRDHEAVSGLFPSKVNIVFNPLYKSGMTSSIQAGVRAAAQDHAYMICLGDMIWLQTEHYNVLSRHVRKALTLNPKSIVMPIVNGKRGNPVIFSNIYKKAILAHEQTNGCRNIVRQNHENVVFYETDEQIYLMDIDKPEDLEKYHDIDKGRTSPL